MFLFIDEVPVIVDEHECTYPSIYPKLDLKPPDPILPSAATGTTPTKVNKNGGSKGSPSVRYKVGNEGEQKGGGAKGGMIHTRRLQCDSNIVLACTCTCM